MVVVCSFASESVSFSILQFDLSKWCHPRVAAVYLKTLWNGWVTDRRLRSLLVQQGRAVRGCMLRCCQGCDSVDHYAVCSSFWQFACAARPRGLGLQRSVKSVSSFLLVSHGLSDEDSVRLAVGSYALHRVVQICRHSIDADHLNIQTLLYLWAQKGADGSKAKQLLRH